MRDPQERLGIQRVAKLIKANKNKILKANPEPCLTSPVSLFVSS